MILLFLLEMPHDNPELQKELNNFLLRSLVNRPEVQKIIEKSKDDKLKGLIK
jgi:hypothetical protein